MQLISGNNKLIYHPPWIKEWFGVLLHNGISSIFSTHPEYYDFKVLCVEPGEFKYEYMLSIYVSIDDTTDTYIIPSPPIIKNGVLYNAKLIWLGTLKRYINTNWIKSINYNHNSYDEKHGLPWNCKKNINAF